MNFCALSFSSSSSSTFFHPCCGEGHGGAMVYNTFSLFVSLSSRNSCCTRVFVYVVVLAFKVNRTNNMFGNAKTYFIIGVGPI